MTQLEGKIEIRSPRDLQRVIKELKQAVKEGTFRQQRPRGWPFAAKMPVEDLSLEGPWPDHIELYFTDNKTGRRFKLEVETYHGAGGSWQPIGD